MKNVEDQSTESRKNGSARRSTPKPILYFWLLISTLMNIGGLTSITDGLVKWVGFIERFMEAYQKYVRDPIQQFLELIWLDFIVQMPPWIADYFVIVGTYMTALILVLLHGDDEEGNSGKASVFGLVKGIVLMPKLIWNLGGGRKGISQYPRQTLLFTLAMLILVVFTLVVIFLAPFIHITGGLLSLLALGYWSKGTRKLLDYYLLGIIGFVLILAAINFQIQDSCIQLKNIDGLCAWVL